MRRLVLSILALSLFGEGGVALAADSKCVEFRSWPDGTCYFEKQQAQSITISATEGDLYINGSVPLTATGAAQMYMRVDPIPEDQANGTWSTAVVGWYNSNGNLTLGPATIWTAPWFLPGQSGYSQWRPAAGCDVHGQNCTTPGVPDYKKSLTVLVTVGWQAATPEALRGLALPLLSRVRIY